MTESRWKYRTEVVTVGENSQKVRQLTHGEQTKYHDAWKAGGKETELPGMIVRFGAIEPPATDSDVADMPPELLQACFKKILALTGVDVDAVPDADATATTPAASTPEPEKKAS